MHDYSWKVFTPVLVVSIMNSAAQCIWAQILGGSLSPPCAIRGGFVKRVCIFVDGENFRHSLSHLYPDDYVSKDYLPVKADWDGLFDHLVEQVASKMGPCERLRTYWYVVQSMDFYPRQVPDPKKFSTAIKVLRWHPDYRSELDGLKDQPLKNRVEQLTRQMKDRKRAKQERFRGWTDVQEEIALANDRVEFRRAGALKCNLFTNEFSGEKAVDVKLATDLVVLSGRIRRCGAGVWRRGLLPGSRSREGPRQDCSGCRLHRL